MAKILVDRHYVQSANEKPEGVSIATASDHPGLVEVVAWSNGTRVRVLLLPDESIATGVALIQGAPEAIARFQQAQRVGSIIKPNGIEKG